MSRFKTFQATGLAPNGRLYAGDLNAIQDRYADIINFAQTFGAGVIEVGDAGLQIVKYGTGELRMTGALRADGIIRALGGIYAGAFSQTQRDAIPSGLAPYGLVILNTSVSAYQWNSGSDAVRVWETFAASGDIDGSLLPTAGQKQALVGTVGSPSSSNKYVTEQDTRIASGQFPVGGVFDWPWAGNYIPSNVLLCYGQPISRAAYSVLHTIAAGSNYPHGSGDGSSTFNLPDYRGRTGFGKDDMGGSSANRITSSEAGFSGNTIGAKGGAQTVVLVSSEMPSHSHSHSLALSISDPGHSHSINLSTAEHVTEQVGSVVNSRYPDDSGYDGFTNNAQTGISGSVSGSINSAGGNSSHQNMPPSIIVNKAMRVN